MVNTTLHIALMTNEEILKTIGIRIKQTRILKNLKQEELALKANVTLSCVQRLEQSGEIALDKLISISRALGRINIFQDFFDFSSEDTILSYDEYLKKQKQKKIIRVTHSDDIEEW